MRMAVVGEGHPIGEERVGVGADVGHPRGRLPDVEQRRVGGCLSQRVGPSLAGRGPLGRLAHIELAAIGDAGDAPAVRVQLGERLQPRQLVGHQRIDRRGRRSDHAQESAHGCAR